MVRVKYLGVRNPEEEMARVLPTLDHLEKLNDKCAPFSDQSLALSDAIKALQALSKAMTGRPLRTRPVQDTDHSKPAGPSIEIWAQQEYKREHDRWQTELREAELRGEPPREHLRPREIVIQPLGLALLRTE